MSNLARCMAFLEKLPPAMSGSGGHNATLRAACECVRFGLTDSEALEAMRRFNARCAPQWSERELAHKIESAKNKASAGERASMRSRPTTKPITAPQLAALSAQRKRPGDIRELLEADWRTLQDEQAQPHTLERFLANLAQYERAAS